ncbi:uncharacterized protein I206_107596 [Kwoniella pini CBS 10737]|uniref:Uncharacterized protein n=1 Tax=Kwoniella pini CBS 10737 TaxID=1296096 RepID=A0A1B9HXR4_9TREE|nr:uncharacterized protein I206_05929 [Kwoniella pini CBS 10737]OCF48062.1 hypothetical protein I206_05929 [Kwoniella pini CBS 10737]
MSQLSGHYQDTWPGETGTSVSDTVPDTYHSGPPGLTVESVSLHSLKESGAANFREEYTSSCELKTFTRVGNTSTFRLVVPGPPIAASRGWFHGVWSCQLDVKVPDDHISLIDGEPPEFSRLRVPALGSTIKAEQTSNEAENIHNLVKHFLSQNPNDKKGNEYSVHFHTPKARYTATVDCDLQDHSYSYFDDKGKEHGVVRRDAQATVILCIVGDSKVLDAAIRSSKDSSHATGSGPSVIDPGRGNSSNLPELWGAYDQGHAPPVGSYQEFSHPDISATPDASRQLSGLQDPLAIPPGNYDDQTMPVNNSGMQAQYQLFDTPGRFQYQRTHDSTTNQAMFFQQPSAAIGSFDISSHLLASGSSEFNQAFNTGTGVGIPWNSEGLYQFDPNYANSAIQPSLAQSNDSWLRSPPENEDQSSVDQYQEWMNYGNEAGDESTR